MEPISVSTYCPSMPSAGQASASAADTISSTNTLPSSAEREGRPEPLPSDEYKTYYITDFEGSP